MIFLANPTFSSPCNSKLNRGDNFKKGKDHFAHTNKLGVIVIYFSLWSFDFDSIQVFLQTADVQVQHVQTPIPIYKNYHHNNMNASIITPRKCNPRKQTFVLQNKNKSKAKNTTYLAMEGNSKGMRFTLT